MMLFTLLRNWLYANVYVPYKYRKLSKMLNISDSIETLNYILEHKCSVSRYGDYEYMSIYEETNNFQTSNKLAAERLKEVLISNIPNHIVCIPHSFISCKNNDKRSATFWKHYVTKYYDKILNVTDTRKQYYDASFTRFYMDARDKSHIGEYVKRMSKIWEGKDVYIIEGKGTRFGVNNDLFDNVASIHRILCPSTNAFDKYDEILKKSLTHIPKNENVIVLCALGMTATILAYDLAKVGYRAIDIGHADIEYMWYKLGATKKIPINGKSVNEVGINTNTISKDPEYIEQIIDIID